MYMPDVLERRDARVCMCMRCRDAQDACVVCAGECAHLARCHVASGAAVGGEAATADVAPRLNRPLQHGIARVPKVDLPVQRRAGECLARGVKRNGEHLVRVLQNVCRALVAGVHVPEAHRAVPRRTRKHAVVCTHRPWLTMADVADPQMLAIHHSHVARVAGADWTVPQGAQHCNARFKQDRGAHWG